MCGLVGFLDKTGRQDVALGEVLYQMTSGLGHRGPDSAGVALYRNPGPGKLKVRLKLDLAADTGVQTSHFTDLLSKRLRVFEAEAAEEDLALVVEEGISIDEFAGLVAQFDRPLEILSFGNRLEIMKQVGSPQDLENSYQFRCLTGTHGIGHTRMSTESKVDLSHSQPFWVHGVPDVATAHNGHITNYHKLRRQYEQRGIRFYTDNDSEIIGKYLALKISEGLTFEEALMASLKDFDGSFTYLAATAESIAYVKDPFGFKPLHVIDNDNFVAFATEEVALRRWIDAGLLSREGGSDEVRIWHLKPEMAALEV